jgi:hypothetical protein
MTIPLLRPSEGDMVKGLAKFQETVCAMTGGSSVLTQTPAACAGRLLPNDIIIIAYGGYAVDATWIP